MNKYKIDKLNEFYFYFYIKINIILISIYVIKHFFAIQKYSKYNIKYI